jgi:hypothetical protein
VHQGAINVHRINASGKAQVIHVFRVGEALRKRLFSRTPAILRMLAPSNRRASSSSRRRRFWNCCESARNSRCACLHR